MLIFLTDLHLKESNTEVITSIFEQAFEAVQKYNLQKLYLLGDIFNERPSLSYSLYEVFKNICCRADALDIVIAAIPGNHDKPDYDEEKSWLDIFEDGDNFILYKDFTGVEFNDNYNLYLMPFFSTDKYVEKLGKPIGNGKSVLLTHIGVKRNDRPSKEVPIEVFIDFDLVISGHEHNISEVQNVRYVGASLQHNFSETPNKGMILLNDDLSITYLPLNFPKFITKQVHSKKELDEIEYGETDSYRIELHGEAVNIEKKARSNVKYTTVKQVEIVKQVTHTSGSLLDLLTEYCAEKNINSQKLKEYLCIALEE